MNTAAQPQRQEHTVNAVRLYEAPRERSNAIQ
jgi:hypothetical protein